MTEILDLPLDSIRIDGGTQSRVELDEDAVREYAAAYVRGDALPEPDVFYDGASYWLAGGFHRYHGRRSAGYSELRCRVHNGTRRDAVLFAAGENATHGIRRSNGDKRKAVLMLLEDEEWSVWSNEEIARRCHVSPHTVADVRKSLTLQTQSEKPPAERKCRTKHGTETTMRTSKIGRKEHAPAVEESEPEPPQAVEAPAVPVAVPEIITAYIEDAIARGQAEDNPYLDDEPTPATPDTDKRSRARQRGLEAVGVLVRVFDEIREPDRFRQYLDVINRFLQRFKP